jgi:hypothetical protein
MDTPTSSSAVNAAIAQLPPELQLRVNLIAEALRGWLFNDIKFETELAMFLIQAEVAEDDLETDVMAELGRKQH